MGLSSYTKWILVILLTVNADAKEPCFCSFNTAVDTLLALGDHSEYCSLPEPGETRRIEMNDLNSPTHVEHKYNITRLMTGEVRVGINPIFKIKAPDATKEMTGEILNQLQNCLAKINPKLSPKEGPHIQIEIDHSAPIVELNIEFDHLRTNSHNLIKAFFLLNRIYHKNMSCNTKFKAKKAVKSYN